MVSKAVYYRCTLILGCKRTQHHARQRTDSSPHRFPPVWARGMGGPNRKREKIIIFKRPPSNPLPTFLLPSSGFIIWNSSGVVRRGPSGCVRAFEYANCHLPCKRMTHNAHDRVTSNRSYWVHRNDAIRDDTTNTVNSGANLTLNFTLATSPINVHTIINTSYVCACVYMLTIVDVHSKVWRNVLLNKQ